MKMGLSIAEVAASFSEQTEGLSIEIIRNIFTNTLRRYPHASKSKKLIFIAVLLTGCIITSLISTNDKAKALPGGSSLQSAQGDVTSKTAQAKQYACR